VISTDAGDAYVLDATAESFVDTFKTELIADRVWRTRTQHMADASRPTRRSMARPAGVQVATQPLALATHGEAPTRRGRSYFETEPAAAAVPVWTNSGSSSSAWMAALSRVLGPGTESVARPLCARYDRPRRHAEKDAFRRWSTLSRPVEN